MRVNPDYHICNAAEQTQDPNSVYRYWCTLLSLRRKYQDVFVFGSFRLLDENNGEVFVYEKKALGSRAIVILNWCSDVTKWAVPAQVTKAFDNSVILLSNYSRKRILVEDCSIMLEPWEAFVVHEEISVL
jgi:glycosidase